MTQGTKTYQSPSPRPTTQLPPKVPAAANADRGLEPATLLGRAALIVVITVVACFATFVAGDAGYFEFRPIRLACDAVAGIALIGWFAGAMFRPSWRPASRLVPAIALCLAAYVISTLTSRNPRLSSEMTGYAVLVAGMYLLLVALMRRLWLREHFERLGLSLAVTVCAIYLIQAGQAWLSWWTLLGHVAVPPLRPANVGFLWVNPLSSTAIILASFGVATLHLQGRRPIVVTATVGFLVAVTVFVAGSRGAWLGVGVASVCTAGVAFAWEPALRLPARSALHSRGGMWAISAVALVAIVAMGVAVNSGRFSLGGDGLRAGLWAASLQMFAAAPFSGIGPGVWATLRSVHTLMSDADLGVIHAHNIFIQALADYGILAIVASVAVFGCLGRLLVQGLRSGTSDHRRVIYAVIFSVVTLTVQQLFDVLVNVPAVLLAIALPVAWLDAVALGTPGPETRPTSPSLRYAIPTPSQGRWHCLGALAAVSISLVGLAGIERVAGTALTGAEAAGRSDWTKAASAYALAASADPDLAAYRFALGLAAANAGDLAMAEPALASSVADDDYEYGWLDLAAVRWEAGDLDGADQALIRAERLGWQRADLAVAAGWLREQLREPSMATRDYGAAIATRQSLANDAFWQIPGRRALWPAIVDAAYQLVGSEPSVFVDPLQARLAILLYAGRSDSALVLVASAGPAQRDFYNAVVDAWNGDRAAIAALAQQADAGVDIEAQAWSAALAQHRGDRSAALRYRALLMIDGTAASAFAPAAPLRIAFDSMATGIQLRNEKYGSIYRRQLPFEKLVGFVPNLVPVEP